MDYNMTDSSGTDDDLPPTHQNRYGRNARVAGNGRSAVAGSASYPRMHNNDMEPEIQNIEREAYYHVLRAFKAQSDAITWEKEGLITELRKELRVSDDDHRELLSRVNNDDTIQRIREWRKANGPLSGGMSSSQPVHESLPSPTVSASRKKQKTGQSAGSLSVGPPPPLHSPLQPPPAALKRGPSTGGRGKKSKGLPYQPVAHAGRPLSVNRGSAFGVGEPAEAADSDPLIGRKVWTRWPADNNFYEAVIRDFKEGRHALVYDVNTPKEAWEWVNLRNISPQDIRWEGEDPGVSQSGGRTGQGHGPKRPMIRGGAVGGIGRGRGSFKSSSKKDQFHPQNGIGRKGSADIELLHTDTLIKEVEKVFSGAHPDPTKVEKAKKVLKEHEQALIEAIARLEVPSDGESDDGDHPFSRGNVMDQEVVAWRKQQYVEMRGVGRACQGPDGDNARHASEKLLEA
ncbi:protein EMSY-LIKE 3-like [Silene latifolia]|uniref:protein EMSY-LIKE 3-like n=1 Tax=Silene latifolia TaxID=37657 RepID=UPI003D77D1A9